MVVKTKDALLGVPRGGKVLDVGCLNFSVWNLRRDLGREDIACYGIDYIDPPNIPPGFTFARVDLNLQPIPFEDDLFDLVVASHIIEHLSDGISFVGDCIRVTKPGGSIFFVCPSEKSLRFSGFPFAYDKMFSTSFFDDPTHIGRPYSPQSLHRLARYFSCIPVSCGYDSNIAYRLMYPFVALFARLFNIPWLLESITWRAYGWTSYILFQKPDDLSGLPVFNYFIPADRTNDRIYRMAKKLIK